MTNQITRNALNKEIDDMDDKIAHIQDQIYSLHEQIKDQDVDLNDTEAEIRAFGKSSVKNTQSIFRLITRVKRIETYILNKFKTNNESETETDPLLKK